MMVHEYINVKTTYTNLYTIFCRIYGIVWHCIMSFCDMIGANVLKFRDFGFSWNHSVSKVLVPLSPLLKDKARWISAGFIFYYRLFFRMPDDECLQC